MTGQAFLCRYSDFVVHEISQDGVVVQLTDISVPDEPRKVINILCFSLHPEISPVTWAIMVA